MISKFLSFLQKNKTRKFRVIPKSEHQIDSRLVDDGAFEVVDKLEGAGYCAFIVGGAVRDLILNTAPKDFDVATDATPEEVKRLFRRAYIIGRRFRIVHVHIGSMVIEVTTFRGAKTKGVEHLDEHGRILSDNTFGSQIEDAARRDFTINALYYNPADNKVWDAHNGLQDIRKKKLVVIGEVEERFREDPVRILRILRFQAKLGFTIDSSTQKAITKLKHLLDIVPSARLGDEFGKYLLNGYAGEGVAILKKWHLLERFIVAPPSKEFLQRAEQMTELVLESADQRYQDEKKLSQAFMMSAILWQNVVEEYNLIVSDLSNQNIAFYDAMAVVIERQIKKVFLTRVSCNEMRDIWSLQQKLLYPRPRNIVGLMANRRLTTAIDFLEIRGLISAKVKHPNLPKLVAEKKLTPLPQSSSFVNETIEECKYWALWWREYINAKVETREKMLDEWDKLLRQLPKDPSNKARKKRKPKIKAMVETG